VRDSWTAAILEAERLALGGPPNLYMRGGRRRRLIRALVAWVAAVLLLAPSVFAVCPNYCSGHGSCGSENTCSCNDGWDFAADCSLRTCPTAPAWADKAYAVDTAHTEVECANAGLCDRETGTCQCFTPYAGAACQRLRCPSDCSGRGVCMTTAEAALFYGPDYLQPGSGGDGAGPVYTLWDKDR
jgi:hypothetical protein